MIVSKLGVKVGNTVLSSLDKNEIELLNDAVGDLVVNTNDSANILVDIISHALSGVGLSDDLIQKLHLIERLSNSVGYELDLVIKDVVTRKVNEIKFNGIYIRRVSDGEIVYFVPYKFYELYAKYLYSDFPSDFTGVYDERSEFIKDLEVTKEHFKDIFSLPEDGSNKKVLSNGAITFFWGVYNDDSWMVYGNLFEGLGDSLKLVQGEFSNSVYQLFGLENSMSVSPFWIEADDEDFEMIFV